MVEEKRVFWVWDSRRPADDPAVHRVGSPHEAAEKTFGTFSSLPNEVSVYEPAKHSVWRFRPERATTFVLVCETPKPSTKPEPIVVPMPDPGELEPAVPRDLQLEGDAAWQPRVHESDGDAFGPY